MKTYIIQPAFYPSKQELHTMLVDSSSWSKYDPPSWDTWINDETAILVIGREGNQLVGLVHLVIISSEEAWLQSLRLAPAFRGKGFASKLISEAIEIARGKGVKDLRGAIHNPRIAHTHLAGKLGFQMVERVFLSYAFRVTDVSSKLTTATNTEFAELWQIIEKSDTYQAFSGLYSTDWKFHQLSKDKVRTHIANNQVIVLSNGREIAAVAIWSLAHRGRQILVGYVGGVTKLLYQFAIDLRKYLSQYSYNEINIILPDLGQIKTVFRKAGYRLYYDEPFCVFQSSL